MALLVTLFMSPNTKQRGIVPKGAALVASLALTAALTLGFGIALTIVLKRYAATIHEEFQLQARHLAESGCLIQLLTETTAYELQDTVVISSDSRIERRIGAWGPTLRLVSTGIVGSVDESFTALLGSPLPTTLDAAVVVTDGRYPLTLSGTAFIEGTMICASEGVQNGTLSGGGGDTLRKFRGDVIARAARTIPDIDLAAITVYETDLQSRMTAATNYPGSVVWSSLPVSMDDTLLRIEDNAELESVQEAEASPPKRLYVGRRISVNGRTQLHSVIELVAGASIRITDSSQISNALLIAEDSVVIDKNAQFSGVILCRGNVLVRDQATIRWPALVVTLPRTPDTGRSRIFISSARHCEGSFFAGRLPYDSVSVPIIIIDSQSVVAGYVVSQGEVELKGQVLGKVITERFKFAQGSATYVNWIHGGIVQDIRLPFIPLLPPTSMSESNNLRPFMLITGGS